MRRKKRRSVSSLNKHQTPSTRKAYKFAYDKAYDVGYFFGFKDGREKGDSSQETAPKTPIGKEIEYGSKIPQDVRTRKKQREENPVQSVERKSAKPASFGMEPRTEEGI